MKSIWKFPIENVGSNAISMPRHSSIIHAGLDAEDRMSIWAAVDPSDPVMEVEILVVGTGIDLPHVGDFIGTVIDAPFVWHVFTGPGHSANKMQGFHYQTRDN